ncbi:MAG: hypothetical protein OQK98_16175 [Gammaproteobacteria bacterium]|nr:hypothetical protein [Gammaproteobacteria bacterium]
MKLFFLIIFISQIIFSSHITHAETINLKQAPASLAKWYKPDNKRQVWLHTMFKLRRELQALRQYAEQEDKDSMRKWLINFNKHYNSLSDMIPEWKDKIKPDLTAQLVKFTNDENFYQVALTLNKISDSCDSCHKDYQAQVAAIYRSPDYSNIRIKDNDGNPQNIENTMQELSTYINQILIALSDGKNKQALTASNDLNLQLKNMGESCSTCHKDDAYPKERILGSMTANNIDKLQMNIREGNTKTSQKIMGEIAVTVCARCHNTHKIVSNLRTMLINKEATNIKQKH